MICMVCYVCMYVCMYALCDIFKICKLIFTHEKRCSNPSVHIAHTHQTCPVTLSYCCVVMKMYSYQQQMWEKMNISAPLCIDLLHVYFILMLY